MSLAGRLIERLGRHCDINRFADSSALSHLQPAGLKKRSL
jgi:hypothetical protein